MVVSEYGGMYVSVVVCVSVVVVCMSVVMYVRVWWYVRVVVVSVVCSGM